MKYLLAISLLVFSAMKISDGEIRWSSRPLSWSDFTMLNNGRGSFKAQTYSGIRYSLGERNGKIHIDVEAYFDPRESWVVKGSNTNYLLSHEQLHFDITELHARLLRKAIFDIQGLSRAEFRSGRYWHTVSEAHDRLYNEMVEMQNAYDRETDHSLIRSEQNKWEAKVKEQLDQLIEFSSP